jgi:hypothetical protein
MGLSPITELVTDVRGRFRAELDSAPLSELSDSCGRLRFRFSAFRGSKGFCGDLELAVQVS